MTSENSLGNQMHTYFIVTGVTTFKMSAVEGTIAFVLCSIFLYLAFLFVVVAANHSNKTELLDDEGVIYAAIAAVMVVMPEMLFLAMPSGGNKRTGARK